MLPIVTTALADQIEQSDLNYSLSRLGGMQQAQGNPLKIEIKRFGNATAFLIQAWPDFWYGNKVLGLDASSEPYLDEIVAFFGQYQLPFRFEITPGKLNSELATRLHNLGFCQMGFSTALYGQPQLIEPTRSSEAVRIQEVELGEIDLFLDLYQLGFGLPLLNGEEKEVVRAWFEQAQPDLYLCLAEINQTPAGIGILYNKGGASLLADATTLPSFQGHGCHTALIQHRIEEAIKRKSEYLTSFVEFGGSSYRNLGRAGLRVAYTKALWWKVA